MQKYYLISTLQNNVPNNTIDFPFCNLYIAKPHPTPKQSRGLGGVSQLSTALNTKHSTLNYMQGLGGVSNQLTNSTTPKLIN